MNTLIKIKSLFHEIDSYKLVVSIIMGLLCLAGSFLNIGITFSYINLYFFWSQVFILLVTLSWGRLYGLISLTLGLGSIYPFVLIGNNGWGSLVPFLLLFIWVIVIGGNKKSGNKVIFINKKFYLEQLFYSLIVIVFYVLFLPALIHSNKISTPFWNDYPIKEISGFILTVLMLRTVLFSYLLLMVADSLLMLPVVKRLFRLKISRASKYNSRIMLISIFMGWIILLMISSFQYIIIEKKTVYFSLLKDSENYNVLLLITTIIFIFLGGLLSRFTQDNLESISKIKELNEDLEKKISDRTSQLQTALTELEAFNYTVSHDLKSPLRSIEAYCQFIQEDFGHIDIELKKMVSNIQYISRDMIEMIKKLLDYSTTTKMAPSLEKVDMELLLTGVFNELKEFNDIPMELTYESPLPVVLADRVLLKEVIYNIIDNSIKFSKKDEKLLIKASCVQNLSEYVFTIKDNGIGFDMEYSGKLFGVFQRLHSQEGYEGSGIGLATIRKIIQMHGGKTHIEGKVNEGAIIYFTMPINK